MAEPRTYFIETLGCPKNQVDSDKLEGTLIADGMSPAAYADEADLIVVNTCAFIEDARQESIHTILSLHEERADDAKLVVDVMMAVGGRMSGTPLPEAARPAVEAMARDEDRVVLRCRPYATFAQPPRHLHRNDQDEEVTHWIAASMPWDAADSP